MSDPKLVKVDNWGIYFLQRLKHFFNRTDYCDLTLQFQDNAQLKVHRLVLSACTEYFEVLERTCEMYDDCLVMPDDLQADVVVPIVNFMYTGQLEFKMEILEKLHSTSEIMALPVLTKLLDAHRPKNKVTHSYAKRYPKQQELNVKIDAVPQVQKRSYSKAFDNKEKSNISKVTKQYVMANKNQSMLVTNGGLVYRPPSPIPLESITRIKPQKFSSSEPRPTRYELPEELDTDNIFENSFCNISYTSQPLMVHPETTKQYAKRSKLGQAATSKKRAATLDIVECKKIEKHMEESTYEESTSAILSDETEMFKPTFNNIKTEPARDPNKLFDQLLDENEDHTAKVTIETTKNNKLAANLDHAKIISEVLKKYPHLVKSNKNIKLKIFNSPATKAGKKQKASPKPDPVLAGLKTEQSGDFTYESDVLDSKQAAKLIAMGAENVDGPWICLICGTPGKALHFTNYYTFRRHLVEVHNEKAILNMCEYCGQKMSKRNHLLHHLYSKHGVEPPSQYNFPKCPHCSYIALTEALLIKHKLSHTENRCFRCNVCPASFTSSSQLLSHIQNTGHKYIADRKHSHQCIYCLRVFLRENNLYAHLKTHHKLDAVKDGIIDESDDESREPNMKPVKNEPVKNEPVAQEYEDMEYQIQQKRGGQVHFVTKVSTVEPTTPSKQKILNTGLPQDQTPPKAKFTRPTPTIQNDDNIQKVVSTINENNEEIVVIDNNEYIMSGNRLILRKAGNQDEFILSDIMTTESDTGLQSMAPSTSMNYATVHNPNIGSIEQANIIMKDAGDLSGSIPIYVSNEEEYKAIMSSNHPIIFDSSDASKTLTVLTAPDATTIDTTGIDLDNSQNNDMMIIQDNYPLNVSEAVVTDNSGIVVVYSHPVGDPNKEYQLLTTQALGQYSQSAAILTQNYETVTTPTPVMSAHVLGTQVETWQESIHQDANQHDETSTVQQSNMQLEQVQDIDATESVNEMTELPAVHIVSNIPVTIDMSNVAISTSMSTVPASLNLTSEPVSANLMTEVSITANISNVPETASVHGNVHDEPVEITLEEITPELTQNTQIMSMETDVTLEAPIENMNNLTTDVSEKKEQQEVVSEMEPLQDSEMPMDQDTEIAIEQDREIAMEQETENHPEIPDSEEHPPEEPAAEHLPGEPDPQPHNEVQQQTDLLTTEALISETDKNIQINDVSATELDGGCIETGSNENEAEVAEKIQNITSDWSEEEVGTPTQDSAEETNTLECTLETGEEVEESIENIQQELEKQMLDTPTKETEDAIDDDNESVENNELPEQEIEKSVSNKPIVPQVKISSLLNDWDDNDSQDDAEINESVGAVVETDKDNTLADIPNDNENNETVISSVATSEIELDHPVETSTEEATSQSEAISTDTDEINENTQTDYVEDGNPEQNEPASIVDNSDMNTENKQDNIKSLVSDWDDDE